MNAKKMIAAFAILAMALAAFAFAPVVVDGAEDKEIVYMNGEVTSTLTGTETQKVIIDKDMTIKTGGSVTISGDLLVKEGVTVTIEGGSFNIYGSATINGDIISKVASGLLIYPGEDCSVIINGTVTALGDTSGTIANNVVYMYANPNANGYGEIIVNGTMTIGTNANAYISDYVVFAENSKLTVLGEVHGKIFLAGYAYFDGFVMDDADFIIYLVNANAVVDIVSVTCENTDGDSGYGCMYVTDKYMYTYTYGGEEYYIDTAPYYASEKNNCAVDEDFTYIEYNWFGFANVTNLKVTEKITTSIKYNENDSKNYMVAATETIVSALDTSKNVETVDGQLGYIWAEYGHSMYLESMTIADVEVYVGYYAKNYDTKLTIIGNVTFLLSNLKNAQDKLTQVFIVDKKATLVVDGLLLIKKDDIKPSKNGLGTITAAHYTVKDADNNVDNYYTTLQKAIDNGATDINMMGQLIVEKDLTVPAGVSLTAASTYNYMSFDGVTDGDFSVIVREGAIFTIADGAKFTLPTINEKINAICVDGMFVLENVDYGIKLSLGTTNGTNLIIADVQLKDGAYEMYTNVYIAFEKSKSGDKIYAYNPKGYGSNAYLLIDIDRDLTLPAGVTFYNYREDNHECEYYVMVKNGAIFTIAGKLILKNDISLCPEKNVDANANGWNTKTPAVATDGSVKDYSVVVIGENGVIVCEGWYQGVYKNKSFSGAYFEIDGEAYITSISYAFNNILDANYNTVTIVGDVVVDNLKVSGTEKDRIVVNIVAGADVTMKGFTFAYGTINAASTATLTGDIGTATGKIIFNKATVQDDVAFTEKFLNDAMNLAVSGKITSDSTASISGIVFVSNFEYNAEAEFPSSEKPITIGDNKFIVPAGSQLFVFGEENDDVTEILEAEFVIEGTVVVTNSGKLMAHIVSVTGTLTVEKTDEKSGEATVNTFIVGGTTDCFEDIILGKHSNGTATINGAGKFNNLVKATALVFNGANVSADVLVDWMAADTTKNTQFYVEGSLWMTAYAGENDDVLIYQMSEDYYNFAPVLDNVLFTDWQVYDEKTKTYTDIDDIVNDNVYVGAPGYEKVYAEIHKEIYLINVNADQGIDNVYIDGVLMTKIVATNSYTAPVAAGTHTLSYTLANGYSGNAVITSIDGAKLVGGGLSFVVNDDKAGDDMMMDITLSGIVKSGYDTDPETHSETSNGLSVTEILLIVVVIIMAVMAVVLIMRLNRS